MHSHQHERVATRRGSRSWPPRLAVAFLALATSGCTATSAPAPAPPPDVVLLIDADQHGAIMLIGRDHSYVGLRRDGTVEWRTPITDTAPDPVRCLTRCPDALLSGSAASADSPAITDPPPQLMIAGLTTPIGNTPGPKRKLLTVTAPDDYVLASDGWLEFHGLGNARRLPTPGFRTAWREAATQTVALAITALPTGGSEARWFLRDTGSWHPAGPPTRVAGRTACLSPDGQQALLLGDGPMLLDRTGQVRPITDLRYASSCAWSANKLVIAEYTATPTGVASAVRIVEPDGNVVWRRNLPGEAALTANPISPAVAIVAAGTLSELNGDTVLRTVNHTASARYTGTGELVVAQPDGTVRWLPT